MVERFLRNMQQRGIHDKRLFTALAQVPRELFVAPADRLLAYADHPLSIDCGQTISQPYIVAYMTELLKVSTTQRVLEIGTGSGYQTAILALLAEQVYTIEIHQVLQTQARERLSKLGISNVHFTCADGYYGWPEEAPFDRILLTCAPEKVPEPLCEQLAEAGRMVLPVGAVGSVQELWLLEKHEGEITQTSMLPVAFVPLLHEE